MAEQAIISDFQLKADAQHLSGALGANGKVRLYKNSWVPTNNVLATAFSESNFAGYAGVLLAGRSAGTVQLAVGLWECRFNNVYFSATGGPSQFINGWYVTDQFDNVLCAHKLPTPQLVSTGLIFPVGVRLQVKGLNIACP